jgi:hypothetical protein
MRDDDGFGNKNSDRYLLFLNGTDIELIYFSIIMNI